MTQTYTLSQHAKTRMSERNIHEQDLDFLCRYGKAIRIQGYCGWYLPHDVSWAPSRLQHLVAITIDDGHVITSYWSRGSARQVVQKLIGRHRRRPAKR